MMWNGRKAEQRSIAQGCSRIETGPFSLVE